MRKILLSLFILVGTLIYSSGSGSIKVETFGQGKSLIFIPGVGCSSDIWKPVAEKFSNNYTCHLISIDGFADFTSDNDLDISKILEDLNKYIVENNLKEVTIAGHSFGGFLAMKFSIKYPKSISKLVVIDAYPCNLKMIQPQLSDEIISQQATMVSGQLESLSDDVYKTYWSANLRAAIPDSLECQKVVNWMLKSKRKNVIQAQYEMLKADLSSILTVCQMPVLALLSTQNWQKIGLPIETIESRVTDQFSKLENLNISYHPTANHYIMLEDKTWVIEKLEQFL